MTTSSSVTLAISQLMREEIEPMPKCGVCGWSFGGWAMTKHAETPCGEESEKAGRVMSSPEIDDYASQIQSKGARFSPEIDDLIKQQEEEQ